MSRYIDADAFEKYFNREEWNTPDEKWWPEREIGMVFDLFSTADMVEVVRCKDCAYHYNPLADCCAVPFVTTDDDFCSWGERREDGE